MTSIEIEPLGGDDYRVTVDDGDGTTRHRVTVDAAARRRFGGDAEPEALLSASFRFLLDREPKESILRQFELPLIQHYFPEYEGEIASYLE